MGARNTKPRRRDRREQRLISEAFDLGDSVEVMRPSGVSHPTAPEAADGYARSANGYEVPRSGWPNQPADMPPTANGAVPTKPPRPDSAVGPQQSPADVPQEPGVEPSAPTPRPAESATPVSGSTDPATDSEVLADIQSIIGQAGAGAAPPVQQSSRTRVFDQLAASMAHARSYDLGSVQLEQRFDDFDRDADTTPPLPTAANPSAPIVPRRPAPTSPAPARTTEPVDAKQLPAPVPAACVYHDASPTEFVEDLDLIRGQSTDIPLDPGVGGRSVGLSALDPGDIILSTTDSPISETIRTATGSEVSHAAIYVGDGRIVEAIEGGVILRSLDTAIEDDTLAVAYRHRDMTPVKGMQVVAFLEDHARKRTPFDNWGLIQVAPGQLARAICNVLSGDARAACVKYASRLRVGTNNDGAFFCSELVLEALKSAGLALSDVEPSWASTHQILELNHNGLLDYVGHLKG